MKKGFTLAEVLITLGIIGVVAAITIPTVIKHHEKQSTLSKVKKFSSNINQAIKLSEIDNDSCAYWTPADSSLTFFNTYLKKHMNVLEISSKTVPYETNSTQNVNMVYLNDGTAFRLGEGNTSGRLFLLYFYPRADRIQSKNFTKDRFTFVLNSPKCIIEPYTNAWNGTREQLKSHSRYGCNKSSELGLYCTTLIEYDGWQISKDYPW